MDLATDLHDSRAIVCNRLPAIFVDQEEISSVWAQGASDGSLNRKASIDVGNDLAFPLRRIGPYECC